MVQVQVQVGGGCLAGSEFVARFLISALGPKATPEF